MAWHKMMENCMNFIGGMMILIEDGDIFRGPLCAIADHGEHLEFSTSYSEQFNRRTKRWESFETDMGTIEVDKNDLEVDFSMERVIMTLPDDLGTLTLYARGVNVPDPE